MRWRFFNTLSTALSRKYCAILRQKCIGEKKVNEFENVSMTRQFFFPTTTLLSYLIFAKTLFLPPLVEDILKGIWLIVMQLSYANWIFLSFRLNFFLSVSFINNGKTFFQNFHSKSGLYTRHRQMSQKRKQTFVSGRDY